MQTRYRTYGIGDVTERTGLSATTLRFYEDEGLFAGPIARDAAGRREYREVDVEWLQVCSRLRSSDMPLPEIRRYVELFRLGPETVPDRAQLLRDHEERVRLRVAVLEAALGVISAKVSLYEEAMANGTADRLWQHGPEC